jgi:hypothetical protein
MFHSVLIGIIHSRKNEEAEKKREFIDKHQQGRWSSCLHKGMVPVGAERI